MDDMVPAGDGGAGHSLLLPLRSQCACADGACVHADDSLPDARVQEKTATGPTPISNSRNAPAHTHAIESGHAHDEAHARAPSISATLDRLMDSTSMVKALDSLDGPMMASAGKPGETLAPILTLAGLAGSVGSMESVGSAAGSAEPMSTPHPLRVPSISAGPEPTAERARSISLPPLPLQSSGASRTTIHSGHKNSETRALAAPLTLHEHHLAVPETDPLPGAEGLSRQESTEPEIERALSNGTRSIDSEPSEYPAATKLVIARSGDGTGSIPGDLCAGATQSTSEESSTHATNSATSTLSKYNNADISGLADTILGDHLEDAASQPDDAHAAANNDDKRKIKKKRASLVSRIAHSFTRPFSRRKSHPPTTPGEEGRAAESEHESEHEAGALPNKTVQRGKPSYGKRKKSRGAAAGSSAPSMIVTPPTIAVGESPADCRGASTVLAGAPQITHSSPRRTTDTRATLVGKPTSPVRLSSTLGVSGGLAGVYAAQSLSSALSADSEATVPLSAPLSAPSSVFSSPARAQPTSHTEQQERERAALGNRQLQGPSQLSAHHGSNELEVVRGKLAVGGGVTGESAATLGHGISAAAIVPHSEEERPGSSSREGESRPPSGLSISSDMLARFTLPSIEDIDILKRRYVSALRRADTAEKKLQDAEKRLSALENLAAERDRVGSMTSDGSVAVSVSAPSGISALSSTSSLHGKLSAGNLNTPAAAQLRSVAVIIHEDMPTPAALTARPLSDDEPRLPVPQMPDVLEKKLKNAYREIARLTVLLESQEQSEPDDSKNNTYSANGTKPRPMPLEDRTNRHFRPQQRAPKSPRLSVYRLPESARSPILFDGALTPVTVQVSNPGSSTSSAFSSTSKSGNNNFGHSQRALYHHQQQSHGADSKSPGKVADYTQYYIEKHQQSMRRMSVVSSSPLSPTTSSV